MLVFLNSERSIFPVLTQLGHLGAPNIYLFYYLFIYLYIAPITVLANIHNFVALQTGKIYSLCSNISGTM